MCQTLTTTHPRCGCLTTKYFSACRLRLRGKCTRREMVFLNAKDNNGVCGMCIGMEEKRERVMGLIGWLEGSYFDVDFEFEMVDLRLECEGDEGGDAEKEVMTTRCDLSRVCDPVSLLSGIVAGSGGGGRSGLGVGKGKAGERTRRKVRGPKSTRRVVDGDKEKAKKGK
ncbi:hypothetical protein BO94DRAFT_364623 [Aspergillus sclerotioniger CBS 115572]|uniref:Uncharacterized protein n=1 Tax=Aspergillus sclerotioniger CBS 115572 TaxID=1450535 RepID=A0A317X3Q4_9EURO|nr:hypothetical protein BO94DRAFT_364623 [Aspergillus sclerotioniger CBS 115572]PWY93264.1 hypothetical protein BO94DRAFT_364623 [Aspergillus sclerotioniger CBS 115572]